MEKQRCQCYRHSSTNISAKGKRCRRIATWKLRRAGGGVRFACDECKGLLTKYGAAYLAEKI